MFDINVWPLLGSYPGDRIHLEWNGSVPSHTWEDLIILGDLKFSLEVIWLESGVDAIIRTLRCLAEYEWQAYEIEIEEVERSFTKLPDPDLPDDVNPINMKHATIDLGKILREEILMQLL